MSLRKQLGLPPGVWASVSFVARGLALLFAWGVVHRLDGGAPFKLFALSVLLLASLRFAAIAMPEKLPEGLAELSTRLRTAREFITGKSDTQIRWTAVKIVMAVLTANWFLGLEAGLSPFLRWVMATGVGVTWGVLGLETALWSAGGIALCFYFASRLWLGVDFLDPASRENFLVLFRSGGLIVSWAWPLALVATAPLTLLAGLVGRRIGQMAKQRIALMQEQAETARILERRRLRLIEEQSGAGSKDDEKAVMKDFADAQASLQRAAGQHLSGAGEPERTPRPEDFLGEEGGDLRFVEASFKTERLRQYAASIRKFQQVDEAHGSKLDTVGRRAFERLLLDMPDSWQQELASSADPDLVLVRDYADALAGMAKAVAREGVLSGAVPGVGDGQEATDAGEAEMDPDGEDAPAAAEAPADLNDPGELKGEPEINADAAGVSDQPGEGDADQNSPPENYIGAPAMEPGENAFAEIMSRRANRAANQPGQPRHGRAEGARAELDALLQGEVGSLPGAGSQPTKSPAPTTEDNDSKDDPAGLAPEARSAILAAARVEASTHGEPSPVATSEHESEIAVTVPHAKAGPVTDPAASGDGDSGAAGGVADKDEDVEAAKAVIATLKTSLPPYDALRAGDRRFADAGFLARLGAPELSCELLARRYKDWLGAAELEKMVAETLEDQFCDMGFVREMAAKLSEMRWHLRDDLAARIEAVDEQAGDTAEAGPVDAGSMVSEGAETGKQEAPGASEEQPKVKAKEAQSPLRAIAMQSVDIASLEAPPVEEQLKETAPAVTDGAGVKTADTDSKDTAETGPVEPHKVGGWILAEHLNEICLDHGLRLFPNVNALAELFSMPVDMISERYESFAVMAKARALHLEAQRIMQSSDFEAGKKLLSRKDEFSGYDHPASSYEALAQWVAGEAARRSAAVVQAPMMNGVPLAGSNIDMLRTLTLKRSNIAKDKAYAELLKVELPTALEATENMLKATSAFSKIGARHMEAFIKQGLDEINKIAAKVVHHSLASSARDYVNTYIPVLSVSKDCDAWTMLERLAEWPPQIDLGFEWGEEEAEVESETEADGVPEDAAETEQVVQTSPVGKKGAAKSTPARPQDPKRNATGQFISTGPKKEKASAVPAKSNSTKVDAKSRAKATPTGEAPAEPESGEDGEAASNAVGEPSASPMVGFSVDDQPIQRLDERLNALLGHQFEELDLTTVGRQIERHLQGMFGSRLTDLIKHEENNRYFISTVFLEGPHGPLGHVKIFTPKKDAEHYAYYNRQSGDLWVIRKDSMNESEVFRYKGRKTRELKGQISKFYGDFDDCLGIIHVSFYNDFEMLESFKYVLLDDDINFDLIGYRDAAAVNAFVSRTIDFYCTKWASERA